MRDPFFVVTTGRSGSLSLALTLSQHPYICAMHEPFRPMIVMAYHKLCHKLGGLHDLTSRRTWFKSCMPIPAGPQLAGIVDHKCSHFIPELAELFPESRFIWLVRDGRKAVRSIMARGWYTDEEREKDGNIWANYRLCGDAVGEVKDEEWNGWTQFTRCCWYWSWMQEEIGYGLSAIAPGRSYYLPLEEGDENLQNIQRWLGVESVPLTMYRANVGPATEPVEWTDDENKVFDDFCGVSMDEWYPDWRGDDG